MTKLAAQMNEMSFICDLFMWQVFFLLMCSVNVAAL